MYHIVYRSMVVAKIFLSKIFGYTYKCTYAYILKTNIDLCIILNIINYLLYFKEK